MGPNTRFQAVLKDTSSGLVKEKSVRRVIFCTGHVYFDLEAERAKRGLKDVAIVRVEQIAPFPFSDVAAEMQRYSKVRSRADRGFVLREPQVWLLGWQEQNNC